MARFDNVCLQLLGTRNRGVEIIQLKPQENAISIRPKLGIPEWTVVMLDMPIVQLQDQSSMRDQPLILRPAVVAPATQETLIPATARLDVMHANERL